MTISTRNPPINTTYTAPPVRQRAGRRDEDESLCAEFAWRMCCTVSAVVGGAFVVGVASDAFKSLRLSCCTKRLALPIQNPSITKMPDSSLTDEQVVQRMGAIVVVVGVIALWVLCKCCGPNSHHRNSNR